MKKYIFYCFLLYNSYVYGANDTILCAKYIQDSLRTNAMEYLFYKNKELILDTYNSPSFYNVNKYEKYKNVKEFNLVLTYFSFNATDSILSIKGYITDVYYGNEDIFIKNVMILCAGRFDIGHTKSYSYISSFLNPHYGELIDSTMYFVSKYPYDCFAQIQGDPSLGRQEFDCKIKLREDCEYVIFARYGYRLKVLEIKKILKGLYLCPPFS